MTKYYSITRLCKADIYSVFKTKANNHAKRIIDKLTPGDMEQIASYLCEEYLNQLYWISLREIVKTHYMKGKT